MTNKKNDLGVKIIRPIRRKPIFENSLEGSLWKHGSTSVPTTFKRITPRTDQKGRVKTGLDPMASRILAISDPKERKKQMDAVEKLKEFYADKLGEDISPESPFWAPILGKTEDPSERVGFNLEDKDNVFDLNNARSAVDYYWIMETGYVAESKDAYENGDCEPWALFYVFDEEIEQNLEFESKSRINGARRSLESISPIKRKQVAKVLGLALGDATNDRKIYNLLDEYISTPKGKLNTDPVEMFTKMAELSSEILDVKSLVTDLLRHNIVRMKGSLVKEAETVWAKSLEEFEVFLLDPKNREALDSFQTKLDMKLKVNL